MADSFHFMLDYLRKHNFERAEEALRIELDARRAFGANSVIYNKHEFSNDVQNFVDESYVDHLKALSLQLNAATEKLQVSKNGMTDVDKREGYESDANNALERTKSVKQKDCQAMMEKMKAKKVECIPETEVFDNSAFCSQPTKKLEEVSLHQDNPTMNMTKWQIPLQWESNDGNEYDLGTNQKHGIEKYSVKPSHNEEKNLKARCDEAEHDQNFTNILNHPSFNKEWMDFGFPFGGVSEGSKASYFQLLSSAVEEQEVNDCLDYLKKNRTIRVDDFVKGLPLPWEVDFPANIEEGNIFNECQAEDFSSRSSSRQIFSNKILCLNKENDENVDYERMLHDSNQGYTDACLKQGFDLGSFLDVSIEHEINLSGGEKHESRIIGFPIDHNIMETPDLLSGFATLGDETNGSGNGYPKDYWDSDTYDDDEDPGYHRQPIEDEAWFLAHEIEYPSDDDKVTGNRKKAMIYPLQDETNMISCEQQQFLSEQEQYVILQCNQRQPESAFVHPHENLDIVCPISHKEIGSKDHEHGFSFPSPSRMNVLLTQEMDKCSMRASRIDAPVSWIQERKESSSVSTSGDSSCLNVASVDFKASAEVENKSFLTRDETMGMDAYKNDATTAISVDDRDAGVLQEDSKKIKIETEDFEIFSLRIVHRKNRTGFEEEKDFSIVPNSIVAARYLVTEYLGSAAFSKAVQARDLQTGIDVCMKIVKNNKDFFDQSLDEIKLLKYINRHDPADSHHILRLYDYFYYREHLFLVCELLRANLYEFQKFNRESGGEAYFTMPRLQSITRQCLEALEFLHGLGLIHCDLKPENILIKSYSRCEIKVIDVGSSCFQTDNLCSYVQSRSYRAPEVILGLPYDQKIDIWSLGCILSELCSGNVLFQNDSLTTLLARVIGIIGPIPPDMISKGREAHKYFTKNYMLYEKNQATDRLEYLIPKKTSLRYRLSMGDQGFVDFVGYLLQIHPENRPSAAEALQHPWLTYPYDSILK